MVVVLQSRQRLTTDLQDLADEIVVITDQLAAPVMREDVAGRLPQIRRIPREAWPAALTDLATSSHVDVVTNDEYCLETCQSLRSTLKLPPRHPSLLAAYLDKVVMKTRLREGGVATPRFLAFDRVESTDDSVGMILHEIGLPAVVKPRQQANSRGVRVLRDRASLHDWLIKQDGESDWQIDEYIEGSQYHVNAIVRHGEVLPVMVGRYLGPLLGLPSGHKLGGMSLSNDDPLSLRAHALNARVVESLGSDGDFIVHTEFIVDASDRLVVIESAARAPGAMLPEISRLTTGTQLEWANLALQLGRDIALPRDTGMHAGWMWVPVMPGHRIDNVPSFDSSHVVHVSVLGRDGNNGLHGALGASLLCWSAERSQVDRDIALAADAAWSADPYSASY